MIQIEYPSFHKVKPTGSLLGFISFKIGRDYSWYQVAVHKLKQSKDNTMIRLVYPDRQPPPSKVMQEELDEEVSSYLLAQYKEIFDKE